MPGQVRRFRALGRAHPPCSFMCSLASSVRSGARCESFELRVVSWTDLRHIVDGSDVTSFVFAFDAFVRDDVDVMKERFVVIFGKWGSAGRA